MGSIFAFIQRSGHWLLFLLLEAVSGVMLFRYNTYQNSVWTTSANEVCGTVLSWTSQTEQFLSLQQRERALTERNTILEQQLWRARQQLLELTAQDTTLVDSTFAAVRSELHLLPARVVGNSLRRPDNLITIDRGEADGVKPDMGVVCGNGLVGVVYLTSSHYSIVMPLLNKHSRVSCAVRQSGYFGYLAWDHGSTDRAYMEDIPRHAHVQTGQWIETSGYSDIFPPGITVGQIVAIGNSADGLSYRLTVKLSTDFAKLHDVEIITDDTFSERLQLMSAARDSMALAR